MANTFLPFGFRQFQRQEGGSPTMGLTQVWVASTDANLIFTGDPVVNSSSPGTTGTGPYVTSVALSAASSAATIRGIFLGCEQYIPTAGITRFLPYYGGAVTGSTGDVKAYICDDPQMLWIAQTSTNAVVTSSYIGLNITYMTSNSSLGNTTTGISAVYLGSTTAVSTVALPFRIVDFYSNWAPPGTNGTDNTTAANIVVVQGNAWDRKVLTARSS